VRTRPAFYSHRLPPTLFLSSAYRRVSRRFFVRRAAVVAVDGMFDPVSMLRTLSEADLERAEAAASERAAATGGNSSPRAAADEAERVLMTPNVYGTPLTLALYRPLRARLISADLTPPPGPLGSARYG
jgi:hypothetical protein